MTRARGTRAHAQTFFFGMYQLETRFARIRIDEVMHAPRNSALQLDPLLHSSLVYETYVQHLSAAERALFPSTTRITSSEKTHFCRHCRVHLRGYFLSILHYLVHSTYARSGLAIPSYTKPVEFTSSEKTPFCRRCPA